METLKSHYRLLLGLDNAWDVTNVDLNVGSKSVTIAVEYRGRGGLCPECRAECGLKYHAPERTWWHLETMQFATILKARILRAHCSNLTAPSPESYWTQVPIAQRLTGKHQLRVKMGCRLSHVIMLQKLMAINATEIATELRCARRTVSTWRNGYAGPVWKISPKMRLGTDRRRLAYLV